MKKVIAWLALSGMVGLGCVGPDTTKAPPAPVETVAKKEPIKPVTADEVSPTNARDEAQKLWQEMDRECDKVGANMMQR